MKSFSIQCALFDRGNERFQLQEKTSMLLMICSNRTGYVRLSLTQQFSLFVNIIVQGVAIKKCPPTPGISQVLTLIVTPLDLFAFVCSFGAS